MSSLRDEFTGITNNEAYKLAFTNRMLRPSPGRPGEFLGTTQRKDFMAELSPLVAKLPDDAQVFDIGGGSGETTVQLALKDVENAVVNVVEPNPVLLDQYKECLKSAGHLRLGISHCGNLQEFYPDAAQTVPELNSEQDLILNIHVIYHLTDFHADKIDPAEDLRKAVEFMYSKLKPGGSIFIVCADQVVSTSGQAARYYFENIGKKHYASRLLEIAQCRRNLLYEGGLADIFGSTATVRSHFTESYWYGDSVEDIVAMCITGEIGDINDDPFDLEKLVIIGKFVENHGAEIGLTREQGSVPQKGMVRANQPQIITIITRK